MNLIFGRKNLFGRWIFGGKSKKSGGGSGGGDDPVRLLPLTPGEYALRVYSADGTKTAEYGSGMQNNPVSSLSFELTPSGCGKLEFTLADLPDASILNYGTRIDVHLFNDTRPWYSGFIITKPVAGTTAKPYKFVGHGFVEQLKWLIINDTYAGIDVASIADAIVKDIVEPNTGVIYRDTKIIATEYIATKIRFDHRQAYDCIKELAEYATDYVFGVDAYREFFFKPVNSEINEQARLWVGEHINTFEPTEDIDAIVNRAYIKGAELDSNGSNIMATVEDATSQADYGLHEEVLEVPSAVTVADAERWGTTEIDKRKAPKRKAKVSGLRLEYRNADGSFNVRRITPEGKAVIADLDGATHEYPLAKIKYNLSSSGITADLELGEPARRVEDYFVQLFREKKQADHLSSLNNLQLKGGSL